MAFDNPYSHENRMGLKSSNIDIYKKTIALTGKEELSVEEKVQIANLQSAGYSIVKIEHR